MESEFWHLGKDQKLLLKGRWTIERLADLDRDLPLDPIRFSSVDGSALESIDTSGALEVLKLCNGLPDLSTFNPPLASVVRLVADRMKRAEPEAEEEERGIFVQIGRWVFRGLEGVIGGFGFLGRVCGSLGEGVSHPARIRLREIFAQLEQVCPKAIPVVSLVTFLIGIVMAYLSAMQLQKYGANIFVVDGVGLAMCRELSPIIVAIIMAGRSGSAFTAQIGAMKLNEEVDALVTLGLSPMHVLVLPRVLALVIAMPMLVFVGDIVGIFGGAIVADLYLGITPATFVTRLHNYLPVRHLLMGFVKAPVFAFFIALIGCQRGLEVERNARSIGLNTTATVVQSIVMVILLNAAFAVVFAQFGI